MEVDDVLTHEVDERIERLARTGAMVDSGNMRGLSSIWALRCRL